MTTEHKGTDQPSGADTPVAKPVKAGAAKEKAPANRAQRSGPHPLSWINLVLMLGLFALAAYAGWLSWNQQQNTAAELAVLRDRVDQAQTNAAALSAREADLLAQARALNDQSAQLQQQVAHNTDRLGKLPGAERQDWLLAEAEYLLRMANQRLQLERDWEGALSMLQAADNVLTETRNPRLNPVRATLAKEMLALRTAPAIDLTGAVLRVQALQEQITRLPWIPDRLIAEQPAAEAEVPAADGNETWYWQLWNRVSNSLQGMIRIRERSAPVAAPLTPDQQYYLQQNMHLMLEQAQVALLRQQAELYQHSLKRVVAGCRIT
ncbi:MAG: uroporphyrinogen-III C-methyltransferase [Saccharospirillaceae bacterium]|nr:uroporphyrinogen-III C-methyltransferase [Saccharospirillaceae bacterium]